MFSVIENLHREIYLAQKNFDEAMRFFVPKVGRALLSLHGLSVWEIPEADMAEDSESACRTYACEIPVPTLLRPLFDGKKAEQADIWLDLAQENGYPIPKDPVFSPGLYSFCLGLDDWKERKTPEKKGFLSPRVIPSFPDYEKGRAIPFSVFQKKDRETFFYFDRARYFVGSWLTVGARVWNDDSAGETEGFVRFYATMESDRPYSLGPTMFSVEVTPEAGMDESAIADRLDTLLQERKKGKIKIPGLSM